VSPQRIQRKRTKGWRLPPGAKCVDRSTGWGNPFVVGQTKWLANSDGEPVLVPVPDAETAVALFRWYVEQSEPRMEEIRKLRGYDLACYCALDAACHADVLLELAARAADGKEPA
jgi:hypothetical protein